MDDAMLRRMFGDDVVIALSLISMLLVQHLIEDHGMDSAEAHERLGIEEGDLKPMAEAMANALGIKREESDADVS